MKKGLWWLQWLKLFSYRTKIIKQKSDAPDVLFDFSKWFGHQPECMVKSVHSDGVKEFSHGRMTLKKERRCGDRPYVILYSCIKFCSGTNARGHFQRYPHIYIRVWSPLHYWKYVKHQSVNSKNIILTILNWFLRTRLCLAPTHHPKCIGVCSYANICTYLIQIRYISVKEFPYYSVWVPD